MSFLGFHGPCEGPDRGGVLVFVGLFNEIRINGVDLKLLPGQCCLEILKRCFHVHWFDLTAGLAA